ncbi:MAG: glycosyl hydrolase family 79 C-terminal domain-containing protein [Solirubrobacteraceae bacterium]
MRRSLRKRFVVVDLAVVVIVTVGVVLPATIGEGSDDRVPATATRLAVTQATFGRPIAPGFLGLSLEYNSIEPYAGTDPRAVDPVFVQLVRNLNPGQSPILRIGGDTTDWTWWPVPGLKRPAGVNITLTPRWISVTRALAQVLRARLIVGINLEANNVELARIEARNLVDGIGRGSVQALELGNEPALYAAFPWYRTPAGVKVRGRPRSYDVPAFLRDFDTFSAALPPVPLAGPALGASRWMRNLGPFLSSQPRLGVVTLHRYPLQLCYTRRTSPMYPTLGHLMSPTATTGLAQSFERDVASAHSHRLPLRVDEINSVSCGADRAVSNTFASSLWAVDALFELARVGVDGVNLHTFPGAGYELFKLTMANGHWQAAVAPEYYGLLMFAAAAPPGARLLRISGAPGAAVKAWATRAVDGTVHVVLINKGPRARVFALRLPDGVKSATIERLQGPGLASANGVTLAGQSFGTQTTSGRIGGSARLSTVKPIGDRYVVSLPATSAVTLTASY